MTSEMPMGIFFEILWNFQKHLFFLQFRKSDEKKLESNVHSGFVSFYLFLIGIEIWNR